MIIAFKKVNLQKEYDIRLFDNLKEKGFNFKFNAVESNGKTFIGEDALNFLMCISKSSLQFYIYYLHRDRDVLHIELPDDIEIEEDKFGTSTYLNQLKIGCKLNRFIDDLNCLTRFNLFNDNLEMDDIFNYPYSDIIDDLEKTFKKFCFKISLIKSWWLS